MLACEAPQVVLDPTSRQPVIRDLQGGETHVYSLPLAVDQACALRVGQQGVDVVVTLLDPSGQERIEVDNPSGADGTGGAERVFWIADMPGSHRVEIRAWGGEAASGRYTLTVEAVHPAVIGDRARFEAEVTKARADALYGEGAPESWRQAITRYETASKAFRELGDDRRRADARFRLGETWMRLGEKQQAIRELEAALPLYQRVGNRRQRAMTLHHLCYLHYYQRDQVDRALELCHSALPLWREVDDRRGLALSSNELGALYRLLREDARALPHYDQALALWDELRQVREKAKTLHNRGRLYTALGERKQAFVDLNAALALRRRHGPRRAIASTLNALGAAHARWRATDLALGAYQQALDLDPEARDLHAGYSLIGLGRLRRASDPTAARERFHQALQIFRDLGSRPGEARALLGLGEQATSQGCPSEGLGSLARAFDLYTSLGARSGMAEARLAISRAERRCGELEKARVTLEAALELIEGLRIQVAASGDQRAGFLATQHIYYETFIDLLMEMHATSPSGGHDAEALAVAERARARSLMETLGAGAGDVRRGVDPALLESERALARQIRAKQLQIEWLLERQSTNPGAAGRAETEQDELLRRYAKLQGQIRRSSPRDASLTAPQPLTAEAIQRRLLEPGTLLLEYSLGGDHGFVWAVTSDAITSHALPAREVIDKAVQAIHRLLSRSDGPRRPGHAEVTAASARKKKLLGKLSRWLLEPVAAEIESARRLLIVADGALQYLPFEVLSVPSASEASEPLIAALDEIVYLPSASALAVLRDQIAEREPPPRLLAVLADPVLSLDDPRLRAVTGVAGTSAEDTSAEELAEVGGISASRLERLAYTDVEARAISALVDPEHRLLALGFDANRDLVTSGELGHYRLLHFATHGELNTRHAELSRLVLSTFDRQGQPRTGSLYAYEVYGLELAADLVVLSACQTALGEEIRGEGLVGLTRGFMHAGAARVVVSLWPVNDRAAAALMERFYRELWVQKLPPAAALRSAKDSIRRHQDWPDPYYWAGFVLQGEWRDIHR